jgi:hypothetical protein
MAYWEDLAAAIRQSAQDGNPPHFVETNCSFATNDDIVRKRLHSMASHGVRGLYASTDPYHQEFVPVDNFLRVRRIAREVFGPENFYGSSAGAAQLHEEADRCSEEDNLREYVRSHPPGMVGRARQELSRYLDQYAASDPGLPAHGWGGAADASRCRKQFLQDSMWEIHVDPYGNILSNCGMILGNLSSTTPRAVLENGPENANRFVRMVCASGALGLAELAQREYAFAMPESVTQTCELCYLARCHLRRFHPGIFGPAEIYGDSQPDRET